MLTSEKRFLERNFRKNILKSSNFSSLAFLSNSGAAFICSEVPRSMSLNEEEEERKVLIPKKNTNKEEEVKQVQILRQKSLGTFGKHLVYV